MPSPPNIPRTKIIAGENKIDVYWSNNAESSIDPISKKKDFEGYRLYKTALGFDVKQTQDIAKALKLVAEFDRADNTLFSNTGLQSIALPDSVTFGELGPLDEPIYYHYKYTFDNLQNGWQHAIALTAFDQGDKVNNLESLESSTLPNIKRVFPGMPANDGFENGEPFVYPNPYYGLAAWEGLSTNPESKKIYFANLPANCVVKIFTSSGDLVDQFTHNEGYNGSDIKWNNIYADPSKNQFSGGEHAWDLLSDSKNQITQGIYMYSVKDLQSGIVQTGNFAVIK